MSRYDLKEIVQRWAKEELTPEQAIGQLLLHIEDLVRRVARLEQRCGQEHSTQTAE